MSQSPKKLLVAINQMGGGGAESHALRVINYIDRARYIPVLAVTRTGGNYEKFLRPDVRLRKLSFGGIKSSSTVNLLMSPAGLVPLILQERPDVVMPVMDVMGVLGVGSVLALPPSKRPKVVPVVQAPPSIAQLDTWIGRKLALPGIRWLYKKADRVIALSRGVEQDLLSIDPGMNNIRVINNACIDERLEAALEGAVERASPPVVLAAGRLAEQKGYPFLLDAFPAVHARTGAQLWILGEGPDRPKLEAQIAELGLQSVVKLLGFQSDPFQFMRRATVFCLSSIFEGFGNVIVEAMACGAPVVSTDCPYGPNEIITSGEDGLLVPVRDPKALSEALIRVLSDDALRAQFEQRGRVRANTFHSRTIAEAYADELDRICEAT